MKKAVERLKATVAASTSTSHEAVSDSVAAVQQQLDEASAELLPALLEGDNQFVTLQDCFNAAKTKSNKCCSGCSNISQCSWLLLLLHSARKLKPCCLCVLASQAGAFSALLTATVPAQLKESAQQNTHQWLTRTWCAKPYCSSRC